jgi:hypothetical protein
LPSLPRMPLPRTRKTRPLVVPAGIFNVTELPRGVGTVIWLPSAASLKVTGAVKCHVVPLAAEQRVLGDMNLDEQITSGSTAFARTTLALEPDTRAVLHPSGDSSLHSAAARATARAVARSTGIVDEQTTSSTRRAWFGERETACIARCLASSIARRADSRHCSGLGTGSVADRAWSVAAQAQRHCHTIEGIVEGQRQFTFEVLTATRLPTPTTSAASVEQAAEEIAETTATIAEEILDVDVVLTTSIATATGEAPAATEATATGEAPACKQSAGFVVLLALGGIGQDVVRLGDLLEASLGLGVTRILVRVIFTRQGPVLLLELVGTRFLGHTQDRVEVLLQPVLIHLPSLTSLLLARFVEPDQVPATATRAGRRTRSANRYPGW